MKRGTMQSPRTRQEELDRNKTGNTFRTIRIMKRKLTCNMRGNAGKKVK
jgi:hypothetical protein